MVKSGSAQNRLGQLFVDLGIGGLGQTLKALNSVSASFLLTKNMATQLVKPIIDISKEAANSAVGLGKMGKALGTTAINAQKLQYYLKTYQAEGLEGDIASLQNFFTKLQAGQAAIGGERAFSFGKLGLDWNKYSGSFTDTLKMIEDVKKALSEGNFTENEKVMHLQNLGLKSDWLYLFDKKDFNINDALNIDDNTIRNLQKTSEEVNKLKNSFDRLGKNIIGKNVGKINNYLELGNAALEGDEGAKNEIGNRAKEQAFRVRIPKIIEWAIPGGKYINEISKNIWDKNFSNFSTPIQNLEEVSIPEASGVNNTLPALPNISSNLNIYNTNNIQGSNAQEIADRIAAINSDDIQIMQYQVHNQAGV